MKKCPHCDGDLMDSVIKCVHCGKDTNAPAAPDGSAEATPGATPGAAPGAAPIPGTPGAPVPRAVAQSAAAAASMETKQEPYFFMQTKETATDRSTTEAGGYVGAQTSRLPLFAGLALVIAGIAAVIGPMMQWVSVSLGTLELGKKLADVVPQISDPLKGTATWQGWVIVISGAALAAMGVAALASRSKGAGTARWLRLAAIPTVLLVGATIWTAMSLSGLADDVVVPGAGQDVLDRVTDALTVAWGTGLWITALGCLLAIAGTIMVFMSGAPKVTAIAPGGAKWQPPIATSGRPGGTPR